jgi:DNA-directed RNA polymerase specialized sigma24 family protein
MSRQALLTNAMSFWDELDFERLYKILSVSAAAAVRYAPETFNMGFSAQDLAHETFSAFLNSPDALGWDPSKGSIERFLTAVLWKKARTHLRRHRKIGASLDDPRTAHFPRDWVDAIASQLQFQDLLDRIYDIIGDDKDLRALVAATEHISGGHNVNQQLAEILGKSVHEVVNLKRRLLNNHKVVALLWPEKTR